MRVSEMTDFSFLTELHLKMYSVQTPEYKTYLFVALVTLRKRISIQFSHFQKQVMPRCSQSTFPELTAEVEVKETLVWSSHLDLSPDQCLTQSGQAGQVS